MGSFIRWAKKRECNAFMYCKRCIKAPHSINIKTGDQNIEAQILFPHSILNDFVFNDHQPLRTKNLV